MITIPTTYDDLAREVSRLAVSYNDAVNDGDEQRQRMVSAEMRGICKAIGPWLNKTERGYFWKSVTNLSIALETSKWGEQEHNISRIRDLIKEFSP